MIVSLPEVPITFHLSLNVADLRRSVAFYEQLFDLRPAKSHDDYAKFELPDPPVILSLVPHPPGSGGQLSHLGLRVADEAALQEFRGRIEAAGLRVEEQCGTVCGYARQNKCWLKDPDGNFWEIYCVEEELDPALVRRSLEGSAARLEPPPGPVVWEHYVTQPTPERIPHADASVDEVRLTGTFNAAIGTTGRRALVREAARVLKPGGKVVTHGLMGDRPLPGGQPKLPGLAALVARVPDQAEPLEEFREAGFVGLQVVKYTEQPWFVHDGVELREVKMIGWKPQAGDGAAHRVLYKGPFRQATADGGWVFPRGQRVSVPEAVWQQLRLGSAAEQFLFLEPGADSACSGGGLA
jgi:catechol 2,3-dioxygenase-like lactoylglutathione lyase family enzyme